MTEIDLLKRSSFRWVDLFGDDAALVANGFNAWGGVFFLNGRWHAVGGAQGQQPAPARHRRAHGLPRRGRRLAERARDRRERAQDQALARPAADREAARLPAAGAPAGLRPHPLPRPRRSSPSASTGPDPPARLRRAPMRPMGKAADRTHAPDLPLCHPRGALRGVLDPTLAPADSTRAATRAGGASAGSARCLQTCSAARGREVCRG